MATSDPRATVTTPENGLQISDDGAVRVLTLDRPDKLNAFDEALWAGLAEALTNAGADDSIKVVVLTGRGRAFSAGQDLGLLTGDDTLDEGAEPAFRALMPALEAFPKPLIAAVNGLGVGFGFTGLLHCDLVLMAASARLKVPFMSLGVTTEAAASVLLPGIVGPQRAAEIIFTEPWVSAEEAVADGIALEVVPDDALATRAMEVAQTIAAYPLNSLVETKQLLVAGRIDAIRAARGREDQAFERLVSAMMAGDA